MSNAKSQSLADRILAALKAFKGEDKGGPKTDCAACRTGRCKLHMVKVEAKEEEYKYAETHLVKSRLEILKEQREDFEKVEQLRLDTLQVREQRKEELEEADKILEEIRSYTSRAYWAIENTKEINEEIDELEEEIKQEEQFTKALAAANSREERLAALFDGDLEAALEFGRPKAPARRASRVAKRREGAASSRKTAKSGETAEGTKPKAEKYPAAKEALLGLGLSESAVKKILDNTYANKVAECIEYHTKKDEEELLFNIYNVLTKPGTDFYANRWEKAFKAAGLCSETETAAPAEPKKEETGRKDRGTSAKAPAEAKPAKDLSETAEDLWSDAEEEKAEEAAKVEADATSVEVPSKEEGQKRRGKAQGFKPTK